MVLSQSQHDRFNRIARSIGVTPAYDEDGTLLVFGDPEGGDAYTVWEGRCVGVFITW